MKRMNLVLVSFMILTAFVPEPIEGAFNVALTYARFLQDRPTHKYTAASALPNPLSILVPTLTPRPTHSSLASPFPAPTTGPTPSSIFRLVSPDDGLPPGRIHDMWITPQGLIWIATEGGVFVHNDGTWVTLYEGAIEKLLGADRDGRVWAILEDGMAIAAYEPSGVWTVYGPSEGWLALPSPEYLSPGYGDGLVTDREGRLWLATGLDDLRRFDPVSQTWNVFRAADIGFDPPDEAVYQGHFLTDVELSLDQKVWVGDCIGMGEALLGQGIRWFDGESWLDVPFTSGQCVFDIEIDARGRTWVGGFDALMTYDPSNRQWSRVPLPPWERTQLVSRIDLDDAGNPWVELMRYGGASAFGEIARYHLLDSAWIEDFKGSFSSLAFGENGVAWLCSGGDVFRLEHDRQVALGRVPSGFCEIVVGGDGRVWISGYENLWWFEPPASPMVIPTSSEADWANLPPLANVVLTPEEILPEVLFISQEALVDWQDAAEELQTECLIDCATIIMQTSSRDMTQLTLTLMRAESPGKAQAIVESRLDKALDVPAGESSHLYSQRELSRRGAPPSTWVVERWGEILVGTNQGPVVLLMEWRYDFCQTLDDGTRYCEGDVSNVAIMALQIALLQLAKLEEVGYLQR